MISVIVKAEYML
ncbi:hypothetical protein C5167_024268 [Papaver somniferum]|uniref:Uncharacterized protein n=1 Tax=Papaver somniferum TaxID=3469 RepID=A0A4Y7JR36_PAPSO|nr:hypothetical protein C5167_024268 [Papaver somniferum]